MPEEIFLRKSSKEESIEKAPQNSHFLNYTTIILKKIKDRIFLILDLLNL